MDERRIRWMEKRLDGWKKDDGWKNERIKKN